MIRKVKYGIRRGKVRVPASKSDAQRAILAAVFTNGTSRVRNPGVSEDVKAMLSNAKHLGATISQDGNDVLITGTKVFPTEGTFNAGESGLGIRMLLAVLASIGGDFEINAEGSLLERDQQFIVDFLSENGIQIVSKNGKPPFKLSGQLSQRTLHVDGSMSSQFLSGLLIGLPLRGNKETVVRVNDLKSIPYVNMTLDTLRKFGVSVANDDHKKYTVSGSQTYQVTDYQTEDDWSAASYWLVAAALGHKIEVNGLNTKSNQADKALIETLHQSGCLIDQSIMVDGSKRCSLDFDATHCPDLFPALAIYAAFTNGVSRVKGIHRLANKESDRGTVIKSELQKMGVPVELEGDYMLIHGGGAIHSAVIDSHNDHRIAMAFAIAGTLLKDGVTIEGADAVNKSYPEFWEHLESLC